MRVDAGLEFEAGQLQAFCGDGLGDLRAQHFVPTGGRITQRDGDGGVAIADGGADARAGIGEREARGGVAEGGDPGFEGRHGWALRGEPRIVG